MNRWWANLLVVVVLAGLAVGGALWIARGASDRNWGWVTRTSLDAGSPLDDSTLRPQRIAKADGWLVRSSEDLSGRYLAKAVAQGTPLTWDIVASKVEVPRAAVPVDRGTMLEKTMFVIDRLLPGQVLAGVARTIEELEGRAATVDLSAGDQVLRKNLIDLIEVPVPLLTVTRGEKVLHLKQLKMLPADVPPTAILTETLILDRKALTDLLQGQPILAASICDVRTVPVPKKMIAANTLVKKEDLNPDEPVCVGLITATSVLTEAHLVGKLAITNLEAHVPVGREAIDDPVHDVWVPKEVILPGVALGDKNMTSANIGLRLITTDTLTSKGQLDGAISTKLLEPWKPVHTDSVSGPLEVCFPARSIRKGQTIVADDLRTAVFWKRDMDPTVTRDCKKVVGMVATQDMVPELPVISTDYRKPTPAETPAYTGILELTLSDRGALGGTLQPGDFVDVFASPRIFSTTVGITVTLDAAKLQAFPVKNAKVVEIGGPAGGLHWVRLEVHSIEEAKAIVEAAPHVEFYLVKPTTP